MVTGLSREKGRSRSPVRSVIDLPACVEYTVGLVERLVVEIERTERLVDELGAVIGPRDGGRRLSGSADFADCADDGRR